MLALEGRKAWTIFPRSATPALRPSYAHGHDASFGVDVQPAWDVRDAGANVNVDAASDAWQALERWSCVLERGDLLFVPAGCAHAVTNLTVTAAISANFVSASNAALAVDELSVAGLHTAAARALAAHLRQSATDEGNDEGGGEVDVPWAAFKRRAGEQGAQPVEP